MLLCQSFEKREDVYTFARSEWSFCNNLRPENTLLVRRSDSVVKGVRPKIEAMGI